MPVVDCASLYATGVTRGQGVVVRQIGGAVTSGHVTKMAVTPFDPPLPKTPAMRKLYGSIFYRTGVIAD